MKTTEKRAHWNFYIDSDIGIADLKTVSRFAKIDLVFKTLYL